MSCSISVFFSPAPEIHGSWPPQFALYKGDWTWLVWQGKCSWFIAYYLFVLYVCAPHRHERPRHILLRIKDLAL